MAAVSLTGSSTGSSAVRLNWSLTGSSTGSSAVSAIVDWVYPLLPSRDGIDRLVGGAVVEVRLWQPGDPGPVWQDVTCDVISARATWGASRSRGVLTQGEGGGLDLELSDPDRQLDPTNDDGPFYGYLRPGMWIRLSHDDGTTRTPVKTGRLDQVTHEISSGAGRIRATDFVSFMASFTFPNGASAPYSLVTYSLHAQAEALLQAAWGAAPGGRLNYNPVTVEPEPSPIIGVWIVPSGGSVWGRITTPAQTALHMAWVGLDNVLRFRDVRTIGEPGIHVGLRGPLALDFVGAMELDNVYNRATAQSWDGFSNADSSDTASIYSWGEHSVAAPQRMAPKPPARYTPQEWVDAVLYYHASPMLEAAPLAIWPANAGELRALLSLAPMDRVVMEFDQPTPPLSLIARAIGGQVTVDPDGWSVSIATWIARGDVMRTYSLMRFEAVPA